MFLEKRGIRAVITPLANAVKQDLNDFLLEKAGISAFTEKTEEKNLIRPLLVAYATHLQRARDENYWINKIKEETIATAKDGVFVIIPDVRYTNEQDFILSMGGTCILAASYDQSPANEEERINTPLVAKRCQHTVMSTKLNDFSLERYGTLFGNRVFEKIVDKYWFLSRAHLEEGLEIGAGTPDFEQIENLVRGPTIVTPMSSKDILAEYGHTPESAKKLREEIESLMATKDYNL